ncbi:SMI1/KNR4 family protein [Allokutzneria albata]|uniref:Cell wall assembly regulator SMI1 n=1 Tax=Allokutzneria albata TaxID=211114 RepID=A0A1G9V1Q5_ALLAB|nr:SMI1/KNR4 family protein [Allokutzneria albata]SDM66020.1 Cell wall assembly regulator SMI1 [Allokutzneria albata]
MTNDVPAAARVIAKDFASQAGAGWQRIIMQLTCTSGGSSMRAEVDTGGYLRSDWQSLSALREDVLESAGAEAAVIELVVRASGGFELSYVAGAGQLHPATQVFDREFRLPGHPRPGMPLPAAARPGCAPTDPAVLAEVTALVDEFALRYKEIKGESPQWPPGATEAEVAAAEAQLGARLPEDLRALYRNLASDPEETGLLGRYSILPLKMVVEYYGEGEPGSLGRHDGLFDNHAVVFDSDPPLHVKRLSRNDWWITVAGDFAMNHLAVDLDPAEHGHAGQIFEYGRDIYGPVRYVATSVSVMLAEVLDELRAGRCEVHEDSPHLQTSPGFDDRGVRDHEEVLHEFGDADLAGAVAKLDRPERVQRLFVNDAAELDLAALAPLTGLRELAVNRAASVSPRPADIPSLERLEITADRVDLGCLAEHPALWDVKLSGAAVTISPLRTVVRLDLSGAEVVDLEALAELPNLRVLTLDHAQWRRLGEAGRLPSGLAAASCSGMVPLADAVEWARGFGREVELCTVTGALSDS